jgi:putative spermidine/putrescine transport system substrate-binding protein
MPDTDNYWQPPGHTTCLESLVPIGRRTLLAAAAAAATAAGSARAAGPVDLSIIDVAGNLQLTKAGIERFRIAHPGLVSRITYSQAPSPELPGKLKAQQAANRVDIDLVLTGPGALSDGVTQGLWEEMLPRHAAALPTFDTLFMPGAHMMQENFGRGQGIAVAYSPSGPLFEYAPSRMTTVPKTAADLLGWVRAHPNRFTYARPYNSGPGWTWLQGLPYILGDADPRDPVKGWGKSWSYLAALGEHIDYYPSGTAAMMKELAEETRDVVVSTCGWDINPRVLGVVPKDMEVFMLDGTHWLPDTQFMCVPKGVSAEKLPVLLRLMSFMLQPEQQAGTYDRGYFYPGPVTDVPLSAAPAESQAVVRDYGRPQYDRWIADHPVETPLTPDRLVMAFRRWDEQIGSKRAR